MKMKSPMRWQVDELHHWLLVLLPPPRQSDERNRQRPYVRSIASLFTLAVSIYLFVTPPPPKQRY
jgi:hypothetical protein